MQNFMSLKTLLIGGTAAALLTACTQSPHGSSRYAGSAAQSSHHADYKTVTKSRYGQVTNARHHMTPPPCNVYLQPCGYVSELYRVDRMQYVQQQVCCDAPPPLRPAPPIVTPPPAPELPPIIQEPVVPTYVPPTPPPAPEPPTYVPPVYTPPMSYPEPNKPTPIYKIPRK